MAHPILNPEVGQLVYEPFRPQRPGKIINIPETSHLAPSFRHSATVKWIDGTVSVAYRLQDFNALIEDHRKKLSTHLLNLEKVQSLS